MLNDDEIDTLIESNNQANIKSLELLNRVCELERALKEIREIVYNSSIVYKIVGNAPMVYYSDYANKRNEIISKINNILESEEE